MERTFWEERWELGQRSFHSPDVHPDLVGHADWFLDGPQRVLVPLCGKTVDLAWLASRGHEVVGVELVGLAVAELMAQEGWQPTVDTVGPFRRHRAGAVTILQGDILDATPEWVGPITRVWDRAAMVALPADMRRAYAARLASLLGSRARVLLNVFTYDQAEMPGPPFSVPSDEVRSHWPGWEIVAAGRGDMLAKVEKFRERGLSSMWSTTYRVTVR